MSTSTTTRDKLQEIREEFVKYNHQKSPKGCIEYLKLILQDATEQSTRDSRTMKGVEQYIELYEELSDVGLLDGPMNFLSALHRGNLNFLVRTLHNGETTLSEIELEKIRRVNGKSEEEIKQKRDRLNSIEGDMKRFKELTGKDIPMERKNLTGNTLDVDVFTLNDIFDVPDEISLKDFLHKKYGEEAVHIIKKYI